jgi:hypothetical protein
MLRSKRSRVRRVLGERVFRERTKHARDGDSGGISDSDTDNENDDAVPSVLRVQGPSCPSVCTDRSINSRTP